MKNVRIFASNGLNELVGVGAEELAADMQEALGLDGTFDALPLPNPTLPRENVVAGAAASWRGFLTLMAWVSNQGALTEVASLGAVISVLYLLLSSYFFSYVSFLIAFYLDATAAAVAMFHCKRLGLDSSSCPIILIGHSHGGMVIYHMVKHLLSLKRGIKPLVLTLGSPILFPENIRNELVELGSSLLELGHEHDLISRINLTRASEMLQAGTQPLSPFTIVDPQEKVTFRISDEPYSNGADILRFHSRDRYAKAVRLLFEGHYS